MKKRCLTVLLMLVSTVFLAACGGKQAQPAQTETEQQSETEQQTEAEEDVQPEDDSPLTILGKTSDVQKSYLTNIIRQYEVATGETVDISFYDDIDFEELASKDFKDGDVPDVLLHFHNADLNRFDVPNNFYNLSGETWADDLTDGAREYCEDGDGNLLGLPFWENSVSGCYYNKTLLDSLGLQPATTQAEFDALCQQISDAGYTPICWPADGCTWMFQLALDPVFADDSTMLEKLNSGEITYADIPQVVNMVQWISDAADKGWFGTAYRSTGWDDISSVMGSGQAAMTFIWDTWFYTDFIGDGQYTVDDFGLMPIFMNTADSGTYEGGNLNMMMVNKNSPRLEKALDFLEFCATPENYNAAFEGISTENCFKGQKTNIISAMVTDAKESIDANKRPSTAVSRVNGYNASDIAAAFEQLFDKKTDVEGCVKLMDEYRIEAAKEQ